MIAATTAWFDTNRGLAVSLVTVGIGVAPMTISPLARWLITAYDWRMAMLIIGIGAWALLLPSAFLVRMPAGGATGSGVDHSSHNERPSLSRVFRSPHAADLHAHGVQCKGSL